MRRTRALLSTHLLSTPPPSLPRRHPNIFHLRRLVQKLMAFALLAIHPIAGQAVADPRPLHVWHGLLELLQVSNHVHHFFRRNAFQQLCHPPFQFSLRNFVGNDNAVMHFAFCGVLSGKRKKMFGIKRDNGSTILHCRLKDFRIGRLFESHLANVDYIETLFAQKRGKVLPNLLVEEQFGRVGLVRFHPPVILRNCSSLRCFRRYSRPASSVFSRRSWSISALKAE